jgi:predicted nucleotidyltransferase
MAPLPQDQLQDLLSEIVKRLRSAFDPAAIYLFGSYAEGRAGSDSDLDLLVVVPESTETLLQRSARAHRALRGVPIPIDVIVYTAGEFSARAAWPVSLERDVVAKGRVLYAA